MDQPNPEKKTYKSPVRKLSRFFEKSRDRWKAKYQQAKSRVKRLQNRVRFLEKRKEQWKGRVQTLEQENARLKARAKSLAQALERLEEKKSAEGERLAQPKNWQMAPYRHGYSIGCIHLFLCLVLSAAISLRGASRAMGTFFEAFQMRLACPSWYAGRLWLMRLGYYQLMRPKVQAEDWVWIIDHTVQLGDDKCLVILGVRLGDVATGAGCLGHAAVEVIDLAPVKKSNGEVVYQQLEQALRKTGVPRAILSDHGTDLKAGIDKFRQQHPQTSTLYDIKHKTAAILKRELDEDEDWKRFTQLAAHTRLQVQQTALAALFPPSQKTKSRYMNVDVLVNWGQRMLVFLDTPASLRKPHLDQEQVEKKLGWVTGFRVQLEEWGELFGMLSAIESFIRHHGLTQGGHLELEKQVLQLKAQSERTQRLRCELIDFVTEQEAQVRPGEHLPGSSEVIESIFGTMKRLEGEQSKNGFTHLLLGLGALVSTTTEAVIQKALETVTTKQVEDWCQNILGQTVRSARRQAFSASKKTEQKRDQVLAPT